MFDYNACKKAFKKALKMVCLKNTYRLNSVPQLTDFNPYKTLLYIKLSWLYRLYRT